MVYLIMGVAGSGKSTVGEALADALAIPFADADAFHPHKNILKMQEGKPLNDADRAPWLASLNRHLLSQGSMVLACSALKKSYRRVVLQGLEKSRLIYLKISPEVAEKRLAHRQGHFFNPALIVSQFSDLEEPTEAESPLVVDGSESLTTLVYMIQTQEHL